MINFCFALSRETVFLPGISCLKIVGARVIGGCLFTFSPSIAYVRHFLIRLQKQRIYGSLTVLPPSCFEYFGTVISSSKLHV